MLMSRVMTRYYLGRLTLFYNVGQLQNLLTTSRPTVERWISGETLPRLSMKPIFDNALEGLIERIDKHHKQWGFGRTVADAVEEVDAPLVVYQPAARRNETKSVTKFLRERLKRGKPIKLRELMVEAKEMGFSRSQLQYAARRLKVTKVHHGVGRNSHSEWRIV